MMNTLRKMMVREGIDVFGTSDVTGYVPDQFASTPYAVTLGVRLSDAVMQDVVHGPTKIYFHHYRTANAFLDMCALKCVIYLGRHGYNAVAIPASQTTNSAATAGDFSHKTAANLSGLGFIGKSGLFVTEQYGPRVRFATVLTDHKLHGKGIQTSRCGDCTLCMRACPCGAIIGSHWTQNSARDDIVDAALCREHMKEKYAMIGRGAVCGICAAVCPYGKSRNSY
ncbi:MAG: 4Fe-4S double cluster binding domain-containing protein [Eubacteriales bacterium]|nr:4Fe-4S double cluster binding domain-containing protein [Eubacteriales bacterium]